MSSNSYGCQRDLPGGGQTGRFDPYNSSQEIERRVGRVPLMGRFMRVVDRSAQLSTQPKEDTTHMARVLNCLTTAALGACPVANEGGVKINGRPALLGAAIVDCSGLGAGNGYPVLYALEGRKRVKAKFFENDNYPDLPARRYYVLAGDIGTSQVPELKFTSATPVTIRLA